MVKCRVSHYDFQTEAILGLRKDQRQCLYVALLRVSFMINLMVHYTEHNMV